MPSSTFSYTSADGTRIAAYRWDPAGKPFERRVGQPPGVEQGLGLGGGARPGSQFMYRPARPSGSLLVMTSSAENDAAGVPPWFSAALGAAAQERTTIVEGTSIAYRAWGDPAGRVIVLVHGGAA